VTAWRATIWQGYPHGTVCQLLALTGQREGEIANLRRPWINEKEQSITLPEWVTKNSKSTPSPMGTSSPRFWKAFPAATILISLFPMPYLERVASLWLERVQEKTRRRRSELDAP
jgi:hypothetical protein